MNDHSVLLGMSGGVDSGTCAWLLREAGYRVTGATLVVQREGSDPVPPARAVADALGIPHRAIDCADAFTQTVKADFLAEYAAGRTPNPCVVCNHGIKFPFLLRAADEAGCDWIATGHYARIVRYGSRLAVARGRDAGKDQSYMLWRLPQETLARTIFPLGERTKAEIRTLAAEHGLPCAATGESQDICFLPDGDYAAFLAAHGVPLTAGTFVDPEGRVLGPAKNQACYTIGQRRSLGIACGTTMYVTAKDAARNVVTIAPQPPLCSRVTASRLNFMAGAPGDFASPRRLTVRLRYTPKEFVCGAEMTAPDELTIRLTEPVRSPACGQSAVLYDGDAVVCGGIIESVTLLQ